MNFEEELSKGNFMLSKCSKCDQVIWPPNEICSKCFGNAKWEKCSEFGKLIEYSLKDGQIFCLAEFDRVRIMGIINSTSEPHVGQKIKLEKSSIHDGNYHFEMSLC